MPRDRLGEGVVARRVMVATSDDEGPGGTTAHDDIARVRLAEAAEPLPVRAAGTGRPEVAVLGLGALGAACLHRLALRGVPALGLEQFEPGHARGSSHGGSRLIRRALFEHPDYLPVVDRAYELWRALEALGPRHVFDEGTGLLLAGRADGELVRGAREVAARHDLPIASLAPEEARRRFPCFDLPEGLELLWDPDGGILRPEEAILAQVEAARALGARVETDLRACSFGVEEGRVRIETTRGSLEVERLIVSAGPWTSSLLELPDTPLRLRRKILSWHRPLDPPAWALGAAPPFAFELREGFVYGFPALDGRGVKLADHAGGEWCEAPEPTAVEREGDRGAVPFALREILRGLDPKERERAACTYTMTPDAHPRVGWHPRLEGVLLAAGFSGHGFKHSIALGEALTELAIDGRSRLRLELFKP